ncbi:P-loop containing nucleoside triphosphate hydrolase protein [Auriculariales sp. MPI-PUGE-AT-0066]|nr:P-loop containing nucleoside triphosphate hydrolase protein [Auriculariales sp. MPI-PUGE-AT-0066]
MASTVHRPAAHAPAPGLRNRTLAQAGKWLKMKGICIRLVPQSGKQMRGSYLQTSKGTKGALKVADLRRKTRHAFSRADLFDLQPARSSRTCLSTFDDSARIPPLRTHTMATSQAGLGLEIVSIINKLQDVFATIGSSSNVIDLPQICVVGSQSSGKSSVLENIVGRDFLPRGTGIVTRRPLVLQLINRPVPAATGPAATPASPTKVVNGANINENEWGEFLHLPGKKIYDFNEIRNEIVRDTEAKTGKNAGISPVPINLRVFSPNVVTLTLVDLPGLTKVPVGDQPRDIEKQIRDMLLKFISKPASIILAVTPGNMDLANSDGLKLAREVDPDGLRTIGVLTKIDLMDPGTDVVDILASRVIPLRLGYVPVVNRGQRDIEGNKSIALALDAEHSDAPHQATLPDIKQRISQQQQRFNTELQSLGGAMGDGGSGNVVLSTITEFTNEFRTVIDGNTNELSLNELSGGARISFVFHELYHNGVRSIDPFDQVRDGDIRTILYNSSGSTPALFVGTAAFEVIVKQQIKRLEEPSLKCVQLVYDELIRILGQLLGRMRSFNRYPALKERFNSVVVAFFKKAMNPTTKLVTDLVSMQACYVNTTHPDFLNGHKAMQIVTDRLNAQKGPSNVDPKSTKAVINAGKDLDVDPRKDDQGFFGSFFAKAQTATGTGATQKKKVGAAAMEAPPTAIRPQQALNERETLETEVIKLLINSYFNIVKREMIDMVPKAITLTLVNHAKEDLQRELLEELYKPEVLDELLKESEYVVSRRKEVVGMLQALNKAEEIVSGV